MTLASLLAGVGPVAFPTLSAAVGGFFLLGVNPFMLARSVRRGCAGLDQARVLAALSVGGFVLAPFAHDHSLIGLAARVAAVAVLAPLAAWLGACVD